MKQKVAFIINAFPSDPFLREFKFADLVGFFFVPFREITFAIVQELRFFFSICSIHVFCSFIKIRTHYSCTYKFPKSRTCKK